MACGCKERKEKLVAKLREAGFPRVAKVVEKLPAPAQRKPVAVSRDPG